MATAMNLNTPHVAIKKKTKKKGLQNKKHLNHL